MIKPFVLLGCFLFLLSELAAQTVPKNTVVQPPAAAGSVLCRIRPFNYRRFWGGQKY
jgi:hypothetical protein